MSRPLQTEDLSPFSSIYIISFAALSIDFIVSIEVHWTCKSTWPLGNMTTATRNPLDLGLDMFRFDFRIDDIKVKAPSEAAKQQHLLVYLYLVFLA